MNKFIAIPLTFFLTACGITPSDQNSDNRGAYPPTTPAESYRRIQVDNKGLKQERLTRTERQNEQKLRNEIRPW